MKITRSMTSKFTDVFIIVNVLIFIVFASVGLLYIIVYK